MNVLMAALVLAAATADDRVVVRGDFDVGKEWRLARFMGKDFHPLLHWWTWADYGASAPEGYDVYRECAINASSYYAKDRKAPFSGAYGIADFYAGDARRLANVLGNENSARPVFLNFRGVRPAWRLEAEYPLADREGFEKWCASHPNFLGFAALDEYDADTFHYPAWLKKSTPERARELEKHFPGGYGDYLDDVYFKDKWVAESVRRTAEFHFGRKDFWPMTSWCPGYAPLFAAAGVRGLCYEPTGAQGGGSWTLGMAYMRGAARLFGGLPTYWYTANCYYGYTRDGKELRGENCSDDECIKRDGGKWWGRHRGLTVSLVARQNLYGWLAGAQLLEVENFQHAHMERSLGESSARPSIHARHFNDLYRLSKRVDRGVPYTPLALLMPVHERVDVRGLSERYHEYSASAAVVTLVGNVNQRRMGMEGGFYNSPFGDIWDVVTPDLRDSEITAKALSAYKAAVLLGNYRRGSPRWALDNFVRVHGGTLFVAANHVRDGAVDEALTGVSFPASEIKSAGKWLVDDRGRKIELRAPYVLECGVPTTARVFWRDEAGNPIAYVNDAGKGRVVTVTAPGMMPYGIELPQDLESERHALRVFKKLQERTVPCRIMGAIFARICSETLPFRVRGDIQYGFNRRSDGWLVWFYNNKGIRHYAGEPEEVDASAKSEVTLSFGGRRPSSVTDAESGQAQTFGDNCSISVQPGGWRILEIKD
jgi:hypothetical protein